MTVWTGWAELFLNTALHGTTAHNVKFLHEWAARSESPDCSNNPIDLTHRLKGSTDCKKFGGGSSRAYQAYASHADAAKAFSDQIGLGPYPDIEAAIMNGNPYTFGDIQAIFDQLAAWGSPTFAEYYFSAVYPTAPVLKAARAHKGWADLQHTVNTLMPASLTRSRRTSAAALRSIARARKVHL